MDLTNPFFSEFNTPFNVPPFEKIMAKHYVPAFEQGIKEGRADIKKIVTNKEKPTFKNTIEAYDKAGALLENVMMVFEAQTSANTNDSLQAIEIEISPKYAGFVDEIL
jgi:peptidyl-dipeptidase Dcp